MLRVTKVLAALLLLAPIPRLAAQGIVAPLRLAGEKVRVRVAVENGAASMNSFGVRGTFVAQRGDTIQVVDTKGRLWSLPVSHVRSIEISRGKDHWRGAGVGALAGMAFGLLMSTTAINCNGHGYGPDCRKDGSTPSKAQYVKANLEATIPLGAFIGLGIGVERWERITAQPRVSLAPVRGGIGLRFSF